MTRTLFLLKGPDDYDAEQFDAQADALSAGLRHQLMEQGFDIFEAPERPNGVERVEMIEGVRVCAAYEPFPFDDKMPGFRVLAHTWACR